MLTVKRHRLVRADLQSAYDWYQTKQPGLGADFIEDFRRGYQRLRQFSSLYSVRFANVRRLNLERFPYGRFYIVNPQEIRVLALLHASRDTGPLLAARRQTFAVEAS